MDREKVIKALEYCRNQAGCGSDESECPWIVECREDVNSLKDATLALLKEQEETIYALQVELASAKEIAEGYSVLLKEQKNREKRICKEICESINDGCSTDTYEDREYVCHRIQQIFLEG